MAINDLIGGAATPVDPADQAPTGQPAQDDTTVTPKEQEAYERVVLAGIKVLSDPKTNPQVMTMLGDEGGGDPAQRLAKTTSTIFSQIDEQSKGTVPLAVVANAAGEILENVVQFANESGVMTVDKTMQDKASQFLWMDLSEMYDIDPEEIKSLGEGMDEASLNTLVQEQDAVARSGQGAPQAPAAAAPQTPAAAAPVQQLPGIINQTIGA